MWKDYELPTNVEIDGELINIRSDWRDILEILFAMDDTNLKQEELAQVIIQIFYVEYEKITDYAKAIQIAMLFISGNKEQKSNTNNQKLMDWEQDLPLIISAVNKVLNTEIRQMKYLHWWTFLGAYMEIGECTFNTFVGIRFKKKNNIKLDKNEARIYRENREQIDIKPKYNEQIMQDIDIIMGRS